MRRRLHAFLHILLFLPALFKHLRARYDCFSLVFDEHRFSFSCIIRTIKERKENVMNKLKKVLAELWEEDMKFFAEMNYYQNRFNFR